MTKMSSMFDEGHPSKRDKRKIKRERRKEKYRKLVEWQESRRDSHKRIMLGLELYEKAIAAQDALHNAQND